MCHCEERSDEAILMLKDCFGQKRPRNDTKEVI
jgi:hypothetical protein